MEEIMTEIQAYEKMLENEKDFIRIANIRDKIHKLKMMMYGVACNIDDEDEECLTCGS